MGTKAFWRLEHGDLAAVLARTDLAWASARVYLALADLTLGHGKDSDMVSVSQIGDLASVARWHVSRALSDLASRGLYGHETLGPRKVRRWVIWPPPPITTYGDSTVAGDITVHGDSAITTHGDELSPPVVNTKNRREKKSARTRFVPPMVEDVRAYTTSIGHGGLDAARFVDYYASRGWMLGKSHMRDWRATVRNWCRRDQGQAEAKRGDPGWAPTEQEATAILREAGLQEAGL